MANDLKAGDHTGTAPNQSIEPLALVSDMGRALATAITKHGDLASREDIALLDRCVQLLRLNKHPVPRIIDQVLSLNRSESS